VSRHVLSPAEFRNAIYLDFEGEGRKKDGTRPKPHMSGIFYPNEKGAGGNHCGGPRLMESAMLRVLNL